MHSSTLLPVWVLTILAGVCALTAYQQAPGQSGTPDNRWPTEMRFSLDSAKPTLVMFVHPRCPCTRASLNELAVLTAQCNGRLSVYVLFVRPKNVSSDWIETDLKKQAERIPGIIVKEDIDGHCARRLSIHTSGETVVYDENEQLRFCGGITSSRGHQGDNVGRQSIESLVLTGSSSQSTAPVFGCPLLDQSSEKPNPSDLKS